MQTSKWQQLGEAHLIKIIEITKSFAHNIFDHVAASQALPERAKRALKAIIDAFSETAKAESLIALRTLCKRHATKPLYTSDPKYLLNVRESQRLRFFQAIDRYTILYPSLNFIKEAESAPSPQITEASNGWAVVDLAHLDSLFDQIHPNGARTQNTQDEVHDILKAYYDVRSHLPPPHKNPQLMCTDNPPKLPLRHQYKHSRTVPEFPNRTPLRSEHRLHLESQCQRNRRSGWRG